MPQNVQLRLADRDLIGEIHQREQNPQWAVVRQRVDAWCHDHPLDTTDRRPTGAQ